MGGSLFRDVGPVTFGGSAFKCVNTATIAFGSDVLRGKCGAAVSERYQGLTNLSVEITLENSNPFRKVHPGDTGELSIGIPFAIPGIGVPSAGRTLSFASTTLTGRSGRITKDELASGTYTFRARSSDGLTIPVVVGGAGAPFEPADATTFIRDIKSFAFSGDPGISPGDVCVRSFEFSENAELLENQCQGELFPTYVGITGLNLEATAVFRDVVVQSPAGGLTLGSKGTITMSALAGSTTSCIDLTPSGSVKMENMNINESTITARHGDFAEVSVSWTGHGTADKEAIAIIT